MTGKSHRAGFLIAAMLCITASWGTSHAAPPDAPEPADRSAGEAHETFARSSDEHEEDPAIRWFNDVAEVALDELASHGIVAETTRSDELPEGFGGVRQIPGEARIVVAWKGEPPSVIGQVREANPDVAIDVVASEYTSLEIEAAARLVFEGLGEELGGRGYVRAVGPAEDAQGISVLYASEDPLLETSAIERAVARLTSIRAFVEIDEGAGPIYAAGTRQTDSTPFYGGAGFRIPALAGPDYVPYCSTGFSVKKNTARYMLTALHCIKQPGGPSSGTAVSEGGQVIGSWYRNAAHVEIDRDAALIAITGNRTNAKRVYWGGNYTLTHYAIAGRKGNSVGNTVCSGGANSGTHCNLSITKKWSSYTAPDGATLKNVFVAEATPGLLAAVQGDSGGPVYRHNTTNGNRYARGMISMIASASPSYCNGRSIYTRPPAQYAFYCGREVLFVGMKGILEDLDVELL